MDRVPASEAGSGSSTLPGDAMNHSQKFLSKFLLGLRPAPEEKNDEWCRVHGTAWSNFCERFMPCTGAKRLVQGSVFWRGKMYYVYVLFSEKDKFFYVGYTRNVEERLKCHNSGKNHSTRSRRPFKLLYYEAHTSKSDAMRREKYFKTTKGKITINQILRSALESFRK